MERAPLATVLAMLAAAAACDTDEPTAPPIAHPVPTAAVTASATVLGRVAVDEPQDVGLFTSIVSSSDGTQRVTYVDASNDRLKYAACASSCTVAGNWQRGVIDQSVDVDSYTSLKVKSGVRHVVYYDRTNGNLKYASCASDCYLENNWKKVTIDQTGDVGKFASLAIGGNGRLHVSYADATNSALKYATCLISCTSAANWQRATVMDEMGTVHHTSIVVGGDGRVHVALENHAALRYATCLASCSNPANWETLLVDPAGGNTGGYADLAVDGNGVRHITYYDGTDGNLRYARCASNCSNSAGWQRVVVDIGSGYYGSNVGSHTSVAVGSDGKVHVSYADVTAGRLKYASCARYCWLTSSWQRQSVDGGGVIVGSGSFAGRYTSLALGGGKVHVSYYNHTYGNLRYAELTQ